MKRFGMIESDQCEICGLTESVQHQLFECTNAEKQRQFALRVLPALNLPDLYSLIEVSDEMKHELVKCLIIKNLIQIDRSKSMTFESFEKQFEWFDNIYSGNG